MNCRFPAARAFGLVTVLIVVVASAPLIGQFVPTGPFDAALLTAVGEAPAVFMTLRAMPSNGDIFGLVVSIGSPDGCRYEATPALTVRLGDPPGPERRLDRLGGLPGPGNTCIEGYGGLMARGELVTFIDAPRFELSALPLVVTLRAETVGYLRAAVIGPVRSTTVVETAATKNGAVAELSAKVVQLLGADRFGDAIATSEQLVLATERGAPADRITARLMLGIAKRRAGDLDGAIRGYEEGVAIADQSGDTSATTAVMFDNLAMARLAGRDLSGAAAASDRALAALRQSGDTRSQTYGVALNNHALICAEQRQLDCAVEYSDRATAVLREAFGGNEAALAPFLEDNRRFKASR